MSGQLLKEVSANVFQGGSYAGEIEATSITSTSNRTERIEYISSGTDRTTTVSTAPSQVNDVSITWPGFSPVGGQVLSAADASGQLTWATALSSSDPLLTVNQRIRVKKNPGVGEFLFISDALASITDASATKPYFVEVSPGVYTEGNLVIPEYVSVKGMDDVSTIVVPITSNHTFVLGDNADLRDLIIRGGTTPGFAAVYMSGSGRCTLSGVRVDGADIGFWMNAVGSESLKCNAVNLFVSSTTTGVRARTTGGSADADFVVEGFEFNNTASGVTDTVLDVDGVGSMLVVVGCSLTLNIGEAPYGTAASVVNSGKLKLMSGRVDDFVTAVDVPNDGGTPDVIVSGIDISNTTTHLSVLNPNATGHYTGAVDAIAKFDIIDSSAFHISNTDNRTVEVSLKGGDFTTLNDAVAYVTAKVPSDDEPWLINIGPGTFTVSNPVSVPSFIAIRGSGPTLTGLVADDNDEPMFIILGSNTEFSHFGAIGPRNNATFFYEGESFGPTAFRPVAFYFIDLIEGRYGMDFQNTNGAINSIMVGISSGGWIGPYNGAYTRGIIRITQASPIPMAFVFVDLRLSVIPGQAATGIPPYDSFTMLQHIGLTGAAPTPMIMYSSTIFQFQPAAGTIGRAFDLENVDISVNSSSVQNYHEGIVFSPSTLPSSVSVSALNAVNNTNDVTIAAPNVSGAIRIITGNVDKIDDSAAPGHNVSFMIQGDQTEGVTFTGPVNMGESFATITPILQSIQHSGTTPGILLGGELTLTGGLGIQVAAGSGYITTTAEGNPVYVSWTSPLTDTMPASVDRFVSVTSAGALQLTGAAPSVYAAIIIARVKSDATGIVFIERIARQALHTPTLLDTTFRDALGPIVSSGIIGAAGTAAFQIDVSSGKYYYSTHEYSPSGGSDITFTPLFHSGGVFVSGTPVNVLSAANARRYDDGTDLVALGGGNWVKHALYVLNDGTDEKFLFVYGQTEFASQSAAENGPLPLQPAFVGENLAGVSAFVVGDASVDWVTVQDIRPTLAFTAAGVTATADHGSLTGLLDDDHTQYLLVSGTRAMTGVLNMGSNNIINPGTIDGVTITDMSDRLRPGGADAIPTSAAVTITALTNGVGSGTDLARADHTHAHGVQTDATLHAVATSGVNGFMSGSDKTKLDASTSASTVNTLVERDGAGSVSLDGLVLDASGTIQFANAADTFHVTMQAPAGLAADYTLTLPPNDGDNLQVLQTDGAGVTNWVTPAAGFADPMTTAGDMIIRNAGNATDRLAVGDTNQVLTTGATGVPTWQTAGAVMDPTVSKTVTFFDECLVPPNLMWRTNDVSKATAYNLAEGDALGISQFDTVSGSNPAAVSIASGNTSLRGGLGSMTAKIRILFRDISGGGQNSEVSFGVGDTPVDNTASLTIGNGVLFYIQNNGEVQLRTAAGASLTSQATSPLQTAVVDTWYIAQVIVTANGAGTWTSVEFLWDGVSVGTITTNLPNAVSQPFAPQVYIRKNAGNNGHSVLLDYFYLNYEMTNVR